ncbi:hypothetical protein [Streptomyces profundus]|uniref:hypothetical protein n=1 Tax=Streptomyces profundus TaxID=2867410 RepID=UPI001D167FAC|nr:hypothetical protein [Streptomyces sp. MA3_2.13]UED88823.1 hypothetical protein K4G22_28215 [Streptomyces sp. MA3_2.13]
MRPPAARETAGEGARPPTGQPGAHTWEDHRAQPDAHGQLPLGYAHVDIDRERRQGVPEVVYGPGKSVGQIRGIVASLLTNNRGPVLVTRVEKDTAVAVTDALPGGHYEAAARLLVWRPAPPGPSTSSS